MKNELENKFVPYWSWQFCGKCNMTYHCLFHTRRDLFPYDVYRCEHCGEVRFQRIFIENKNIPIVFGRFE